MFNHFSPRKRIFLTYLLRQLGFVNNDQRTNYLKYLHRHVDNLKSLGIRKAVFDPLGRKVPENPEKYVKYKDKGDYYVPENYSILNYLKWELEFRKKGAVASKHIAAGISATDLSNYSYCPVSYAINKSFDLPKPTSAIIGTKEHDKQRLINFITVDSYHSYFEENKKLVEITSESQARFLNDTNQSFFKELEESVLVYSGHHDDRRTFKSVKGDFNGQPDYIFRNKTTNQFFIVEEKYQYDSSHNNRVHFFDNHKTQLRSYVFGISDFVINHGYLVYWKYDFNYGDIFLYACNVHREEKSKESRDKLVALYRSLRQTIADKGGTIDPEKLNPAKCATCVTSSLCGHKTGLISEFYLPYKREHFSVKKKEFPIALKFSGTYIDSLKVNLCDCHLEEIRYRTLKSEADSFIDLKDEDFEEVIRFGFKAHFLKDDVKMEATFYFLNPAGYNDFTSRSFTGHLFEDDAGFYHFYEKGLENQRKAKA